MRAVELTLENFDVIANSGYVPVEDLQAIVEVLVEGPGLKEKRFFVGGFCNGVYQLPTTRAFQENFQWSERPRTGFRECRQKTSK